MAGHKNFEVDQGAVFERTIYRRLSDKITPVELTNMDARMQIRNGIDATTPLVVLTSNPPAGLTVDEPNGAVAIRIGADVTATFPTDGDLVYDLEVVDRNDPTEVIRLLGGEMRVSAEVTR